MKFFYHSIQSFAKDSTLLDIATSFDMCYSYVVNNNVGRCEWFSHDQNWIL